MEYIDQVTNERYIPYVVETSAGCDRLFLALLCDAYTEDVIDGEERVMMRFSSAIAPVKAAVLPLMKKGEMGEKASQLHNDLAKKHLVQYDAAGSIGKRYRRQDEIGTPFCFTVDHETLDTDTVTVRYRDSAKQERLAIDRVQDFLQGNIV